MSDFDVGLVGLAVLSLLFLLRVPVGTAMLVVGAGGVWALHQDGALAALRTLGTGTFAVSTLYVACLLPLIALHGQLAAASGMNHDTYRAAIAVFAKRRGGLLVASFAGAAALAGMTGSSLAAAATMGQKALLDMRRAGGRETLAAACVAAGATLGVLALPSTALVMYAILTGQSIESLVVAALIPGLTLFALFVLTILLWLRHSPDDAPQTLLRTETDSVARLVARTLPAAAVTIFLWTGLFYRWFDAVEAIGLAALVALFVCAVRGRCQPRALVDVLAHALRSSAMVFWLLIGASSFMSFISLSGLPAVLVDTILSAGVPPGGFILICLALLALLGMFLDALTVIVIAMPLIQPALQSLHVDLVWFGIAAVLALEMGLLLPPLGTNLFVLHGLTPELQMGSLFRGLSPFLLAMLLCLLALVAFPQIVMWLPDLMASPPRD